MVGIALQLLWPTDFRQLEMRQSAAACFLDRIRGNGAYEGLE